MMIKKFSPFSLFLSLLAIFSTFYSILGKSLNIIKLVITIALLSQMELAFPFGATQCAGDRYGSDLECTANDVSITGIKLAPSNTVTKCIAGVLPNPSFVFLLTVNFATPDRYDIGIFLSNTGKYPKYTSANPLGATSCSTSVLPNSGQFENIDGLSPYTADICGDGNGTLNGVGYGELVMGDNNPAGDAPVEVVCQAMPYSNGKLAVPFVVSWDQQATPNSVRPNYGICTSNFDPVPGAPSKCNAPDGNLPADVEKMTVDVVVLPKVEKTVDKSTVTNGDTLTYTVKITNTIGDVLRNAVFKDAAIQYLNVTNVICSASTGFSGSPTCPLSSGIVTVANMQGSGISLPDMPIGSTLTFTIIGKITGNPPFNTALTNTACVKVSTLSITTPLRLLSEENCVPAPTSTVKDRPTLTLLKSVINDNGGTKTLSDFILIAEGLTTTISGKSGDATITSAQVPTGIYTLRETTLGGKFPIPGYNTEPWNCTAGTLNGDQLTLAAGNNATCTLKNNDKAGTLTIRKITKGANNIVGVGGAFTIGSFTNATNSSFSVTTDAANFGMGSNPPNTSEPKVAGTVNISSADTPITFQETLPGGSIGWEMTGASCVDNNGASTGNGTNAFSVSFDQVTHIVTIPSNRVKSGSDLVCDVINSRRTLQVTKQIIRSPQTDTFRLRIDGSYYKNGAADAVSTITNGETTGPIVVNSGSHSIGEQAVNPTQFNGTPKYNLRYECTDSYGVAIPSASGFVNLGSTNPYDVTAFSLSAPSSTSPLDDKQLQVNCVIQNIEASGFSVSKVATTTDATQAFPFLVTYTPSGTDPVANSSLGTGFTLYGSNNGLLSSASTTPSMILGTPITNANKNRGTYLIKENAVAGWTLINISCTKNGSAVSPVNPSDLSQGVSITLAGGESAECKFINRKNTVITVKKKLAPTTDSGRFDLKVNTTTVKTSAGDNDSGSLTLSSGGLVTVSEVASTGTSLSDYDTTLTCKDNSTGLILTGLNAAPLTSASFIAAEAQQVTCEFTNTRKAFLTLAKKVTARANTTDNFTISINNGGPSLTTTATAPANGGTVSTSAFQANVGTTYTLKEVGTLGTADTDLSNYTSTYDCTNSFSGTGATSGFSGTATDNTTPPYSFTVAPKYGDNITCTFTNTVKPATVELTKTTSGGASDPDSFSFTLSNPVATGTVKTTADATATSVGTYAATTFNGSTPIEITESSIPAAWSMTGAGCSGLKYPDTITVDLANRKITIPGSSVIPGATIKCNFTNTKKATVTVQKDRLPSTDAGWFDLKVNSTVVTTAKNNGDSGSLLIPAGSSVTVSEVSGNPGTILSNYTSTLTCYDTALGVPASAASPSVIAGLYNANYNPADPPSFIPNVGQQIKCIFTNSLAPKLKLVKSIPNGVVASITDKFKIAIIDTTNSVEVSTPTEVDGIDAYGSTSAPTATGTPLIDGRGYKFKESGVGTTNLANYTITHSCTNANSATPVITSACPGAEASDSCFTVTAHYTDNITCTFTNTLKSTTIKLTKALSVNRVGTNDQFTVQIKNSSGAVVNDTANSTTAGSGNAITAGSGTTGSYNASIGGVYTLAEVGANGANLANYGQSLTCTNNGNPIAASINVPLAPLNAGDNIDCILTNGSVGTSLTINKTTVNGFGSFDFTVKNGATTLPVVTVATASGTNPKSSAVQTLTETGATTITETIAAGWTITSGACTDDPAKPNKWLAVKNVVTIPAIDLTKTYTCNFKNTKTGPSITGTVFKDSGTSSGTANDGIKNGGETGISKVTVKLTDCAAAPATVVYSTAVTDANGSYSLSTAGVATGTVCIEESNLSGYISTGASPTAGGTYDRTSDKITFALTADQSYTGMDFGDVPDNSFLIDGTKTGRPGATVFYPHTFTAGSAGKVTFSLPGAIANPAISGWSELLYKDSNCDGVINTAGGDISVITSPATEITVAEGDKICLILKEFIPANAPMGASNLVKVQASFVYTNATPALTATYTRQDLTRVSDVALDLLKMVRLDSTSNWLTSNTAKSGQVLEYQITYTNNASTVINNLVVNDATPAYTTFVSATCPAPAALPANLTNCTVSSSPSAGSTGGIKWTFTGSLAPGASGTVTFKVQVD